MARSRTVLAILLCFFIAPQWTWGDDDPLEPDVLDDYELHKLLVDTITQVERNYVKPIDRRKLVEAAIDGLLRELDEYSDYVAPEDMSGFRTAVTHEFGGIGIQIGMQDGQLTVISPLVGSPAYEAGLIAGDRIVEIDGTATEGFRIDDAVKLLKGEEGSSVLLEIRHPGASAPVEVKLTREVIHLETVLGDLRDAGDKWDYMLDDDLRIGYVRITGFGQNTTDDLRKVLSELKDQGMAGLILDLRFNPGGLLSSAIQVSDLFVSDGRIVSTEGRNVKERVWNARKRGTYTGFPLALLVNRYSASASEIVSACLQDHDRAVVIGERTYGKGSVQRVIEMEEGQSALKLTTAGYHRPNGKNIHRYPGATEEDEWGVKPNEGFELKLSRSELGRLVRYRRERDVLKPSSADAEEAHDSGSTDAEKSDEGQPDAEESESEEAGPEGDDAERNRHEQQPDVDEGEDGDDAEEEFVDRQLNRALEYLRSELTRQVAEKPKPDKAAELAEAPEEKMEAAAATNADPQSP